MSGVLIGCLYAPNGNPQPGPKFDYKLAWLERLTSHAADLLATGAPVVLAGDYNVVPTPADIYPTSSLDGNAPHPATESRRLCAATGPGLDRRLRALQPEGPLWTFWDYLRGRWPADKGMRLDHLLLSPNLAGTLKGGGVDRWVRGEPGASDHAPAWIEIDPPSVRHRRPARATRW